MKRGILFITLAVIVLTSMALAGCGGTPIPQKTTPTPAPAPAPAAPAATKTYEWKLESFCPAGMDRFTEDISVLAKMIDQYTNGRIKVTTYPVGALVPQNDLLSGTAKNVIQMSHTAAAYWTGILPVAGVEFSMPMAYQTCEDAWTVMWYKGMQDLLQKAYNEKGVYYLGFQTPMGNRLITTKPIKTLGDLKGIKVRAVGTFATYAEKLGMSPVNLPMTEVYMGLKLGTIEGGISGMDVHSDSKHWEVAKYLLNSPKLSFAEPLNVLVNLELWNSLPKDLQSILQLVVRDWSHWGGMVVEPARITKTINTFKTGNVNLVDFSAEDTAKMQAMAVEVWDDWAKKDKYCTDGVAILKNYLKEIGRLK